jgi:hypothetical protein
MASANSSSLGSLSNASARLCTRPPARATAARSTAACAGNGSAASGRRSRCCHVGGSLSRASRQAGHTSRQRSRSPTVSAPKTMRAAGAGRRQDGCAMAWEGSERLSETIATMTARVTRWMRPRGTACCCACAAPRCEPPRSKSAAPDPDQSCSIFTGGAAAADADGGAGDGPPDAATAGIGGAAGVSALMAAGVSVLMPLAGASSTGGEAAVSMRCGGRRVKGAGGGAAGASGLTAAGVSVSGAGATKPGGSELSRSM